MGELHLEIIVDRLKREYGVNVNVSIIDLIRYIQAAQIPIRIATIMYVIISMINSMFYFSISSFMLFIACSVPLLM